MVGHRAHPGLSLPDALARAGSGLFVAHEHAHRPVETVALLEPGGASTGSPGALLLAVGTDPADDAALHHAAAEAARTDAAGLVVRITSPAQHDALVVLGATYAVTTVGAEPRTDWLTVAERIRAAIRPSVVDTVAGIPLGDLFAFSNVVARATGGATAVVDVGGAVLGFSTLPNQPLDALRRRTTLYLTEPEPVAGDPDYQRVYASPTPVRLVGAPGTFNRVAVAVRGEGEILGSIWVVVSPGRTWGDVEEPLGRFLEDAAAHLGHSRVTAGVERSREAALLQSLLRGDDPDNDVAALALDDRKWFRLASLLPSVAEAPLSTGLRHAVTSWVRITHRGCVVTEDRSLPVLLFSGDRPEEWPRAIKGLRSFLEESEAVQRRATLLTSTSISVPRNLSAEWERLRIFARMSRTLVDDGPLPAVLELDDHWVPVELRWLAHLYRGNTAGRSELVERIRAHDRAHHTGYWTSLLALADHDRNIANAAIALNIHPNTLRHRIERIGALFQLDATNFTHLAWLMIARYLPDVGESATIHSGTAGGEDVNLPRER